MCDGEFKTKGNNIWTKYKIEPQHIHKSLFRCLISIYRKMF